MINRKVAVSVVIPNLNGERSLEKNLSYLLAAQNYAPNQISEIIVVDDGSWDKSVLLLKKNFPSIRIFKHKISRGLPAAINTGVRAAKSNLILLIHSDVVPTKDFLVPVLKHFRNKKTFAVSLHVDGSGPYKGRFSGGYIKFLTEKEGLKPDRSFYVSDGCGVFRRSIWMELGGMDEKLLSPIYWEDIDICYRAEKRGYINLWEPDAHVTHNHESIINTFSKSYVQRISERNQLLVIWKNIQSPALIRWHFVGVLRKLVKHPKYVRILFMALLRLGTVLKERKKEIRLSKISDEVVFSRYK